MAKKDGEKKGSSVNEEFSFTIISVTGFDTAKLHILGNASPKVGDPDSIESFVYDLSFTDRLKTDPLHDIDGWATGMDETRKGTMVAVTMDGELVVGRGRKWTVKDLGCPEGILGVWAAGEDEYFAAGAAGERIHIVGKDVDLSPEKEKRGLNAVHGSTPRHVVIVGDDDAVFRYDGKKWIKSEAPTKHNLLAVCCVSKKETYIAGAEGAVFRSTGDDDWEAIRAPDATFTSLAWYRNALYLTAGEEGVFLLGKDGVEPFKKFSNPTDELRTIGDHLFAFGNDFMARHDGKIWFGGTLKF